jgi:hypothetical protein
MSSVFNEEIGAGELINADFCPAAAGQKSAFIIKSLLHEGGNGIWDGIYCTHIKKAKLKGAFLKTG